MRPRILLLVATFTACLVAACVGWAATRMGFAAADLGPGQEVVLRSSGRSVTSRVGPPTLARSARAATFVVTYDAAFQSNSAARAAFQSAIDIWSGQLTSSVPITVDARFRSDLGTNVLGSAGAGYSLGNFSGAPVSGIYYPAALAAKLGGRDAFPASPMIRANFSSIADWYYGTDGNTPDNLIDFESVVLHEIGHGLGFAGTANVSNGVGTVGFAGYLAYDVGIVNGDGASLQTLSTLPLTSALLGGAGGLRWDGANGKAGNGGDRPKLYAPTVWQNGTSYSHLDEATYPEGHPSSLMTPRMSFGESIHDPGPIARGILVDIGWAFDTPTVTPVPGDCVLIIGPQVVYVAAASRNGGFSNPGSPACRTSTATATPSATLSPTATPSPTRSSTSTRTTTATATVTSTATVTPTPTP